MTNYLYNARHHLKTINQHRWLVFQHCVKAGIPLQGLKHDLSKYAPVEFWNGVKYYQGGHRSPNVGERKDKGYSDAWLHHRGRNRHHFEYWFDNSLNAFELVPVEMPLQYVIEMFCDRVAASKVYQGERYTDQVPLKYFGLFDYSKLMHPNTQAILKKLLVMLAEEGEDTTFTFIRKARKHPEKYLADCKVIDSPVLPVKMDEAARKEFRERVKNSGVDPKRLP